MLRVRNRLEPEGTWREYGEAKGELSIPGEHDLELTLNWEAAGNLTYFLRLHAEALHSLIADDTRIGDKEIVLIKAQTELKKLSLSKTRITDEGVSLLVNMSSLEEISFRRTDITDKALDYIAQMKSLKKVDLRDTLDLTDAGVSALKASRPDLEIVR